jgi:hypothetical protein
LPYITRSHAVERLNQRLQRLRAFGRSNAARRAIHRHTEDQASTVAMASFTPINKQSYSSTPRRATRSQTAATGHSKSAEKASKRRSKSMPIMVHRTPVTSAHAGTQELDTISRETVVQERAKHGLDQLIQQAMDGHKDPGSRAQTA